MQNNKYFEIVKCTAAQAWKIRLWLIGLPIVLYILIIYSPFRNLFTYLGYSGSNGCPFFTLTGIPCPTCGMGRGMTSFINFDTAHFFYYNPSSIFLYLITALIFAALFILSLFKYKVKLKKSIWGLWPAFIIFVSVVWILNIFFGHHIY